MQRPAEIGYGSYEGTVSPNLITRPLVPTLRGEGTWGALDPSAEPIVRGTERAFGYLGGQDAVAANMVMRPTSGIPKRDLDAASILWPEPPTGEQVQQLEALTREVLPDAPPFVAPGGAGRTSLLAPETPDFYKRMNKARAKFDELVGREGSIAFGKQFRAEPGGYAGYFEEIPWNEAGTSPATHWLLQAFDSPAAPALASKADSPAMREVVADVLSVYDDEVAAGQVTLDPKYRLALETWSKKGLGALRDLARQGLVPAIFGAVVAPAALESEPQTGPSS